MNKVTKLKSSGQIVYPVGGCGSMHTMVLLPFKRISKKGNRGELMRVKNDNLTTVNEYAG